MLERCVFTGNISFIRNNVAYVVTGEIVHGYNLNFYRHLIDLDPKKFNTDGLVPNENRSQMQLRFSQQIRVKLLGIYLFVWFCVSSLRRTTRYLEKEEKAQI